MSGNDKAKRDPTLRTGGYALSLLAAPLNVSILTTLAREPATLAELRQAVGAPPQTTVRKHLAALADAGIVSRERRGGVPGTATFELCRPGRDLVGVSRLLDAWLAAAPAGSVELGSVAAKSAIKALVEGWSTTLLRALAARPFSLTQLDALISGISYPSLERRLLAMRMTGQVEAASSSGRGTPYAVTDWLRRAVAPLVSAACWERRHLPERTVPITRIDIETAFLLAVPTMELDADLSGVCQLAVESTGGGERRRVGVLAGIEEGRVAYCRARLEGEATGWAIGSVNAWFRSIGDSRFHDLEAGGDRELVSAVVAGLHSSLAKPDALTL